MTYDEFKKRCEEEGLTVRPYSHGSHLRISSKGLPFSPPVVNFYPSAGTIYVDGDKRAHKKNGTHEDAITTAKARRKIAKRAYEKNGKRRIPNEVKSITIKSDDVSEIRVDDDSGYVHLLNKGATCQIRLSRSLADWIFASCKRKGNQSGEQRESTVA